MPFKLKIETKQKAKIEEGLNHLTAGLKESGKGLITAKWKLAKEKNGIATFECEFDYAGANRATNWILKKEFDKTLHKLDKDVKLS